MSGSELTTELSEGVLLIRLNRPERKNAFTWPLIESWAAALERAAADEAVRAVVVTGTGDAFCSGVDLAALDEIDDTPIARKRMLTDRVHRVFDAVSRIDKPVLAAVNGAAVGAGMDMALMCDIRFAARSARFSEAYIGLGLVPGDGGCYFLPRLVGLAKALELLLSGEFVDAEEAHRIGIVNRVYEDSELLEQTLAFAKRLADSSPIALRMIKRATYQGLYSRDAAAALDLISSHMGVVMASEDFAEARRALAERRPPRFEGL